MARRRRGPIAISIHAEVEEDTRPLGSVRFADPSTADMTSRFNTFNEPYSPSSKGTQTGIRSVRTDRLGLSGYGLGGDQWSEMNRKRGVFDKDDEKR